MPSLREARLRHAAYYEQVLREANTFYKQGGEALQQGLALFDQEWANIQAGWVHAAHLSLEDDVAARLCNSYPGAGAFLLDLRLLEPPRR
jgi:hypothetical protein